MNVKPSIDTVVRKIESLFQVERYYAYLDGSQKKHNKKWIKFSNSQPQIL